MTSAFDLTDPSLFQQGAPLDVYRWMREAAPLFWHEPTAHTPNGEGFWCLSRWSDVNAAARQPDRFSSVTGGGRDGGGTLIDDLPLGFAAGVLFNMQDDPRHQCIRRLVTPSVSPRRLGAIESELQGRCDAILDAALEGESVDLLTDIAAELPLQAIAMLMGIPQEDRAFLMEWADATLDFEDHDPGAPSPRAQRAQAEMSSYCETMLEHKRAEPGKDLLSIITHAVLPEEAEPGGPLSAIEQSMFFHLLVAAGTETTRNSIAAGLLALIDRPAQWNALQADRSLVPSAVEEILRWASSTIYNRRTATEPIDMHGQRIHSGDKVVLWWQSANFDERTFDSPDSFDIQRSPNPHLAFGAGPHFCLGSNLARLEIRLVLNGLLDRVDRLELVGQVERTRSNKHAGFRHVPVRLVRR